MFFLNFNKKWKYQRKRRELRDVPTVDEIILRKNKRIRLRCRNGKDLHSNEFQKLNRNRNRRFFRNNTSLRQ